MNLHHRKASAVASFWLSVLLTAIWMHPALADGVIFFDIPLGVGHSADQRAILVFDPETKTQTMVLSTMYVGQPADFAWVIPVPNLPSRDQVAVWEGGEIAFWELFDKTEPRLQRGDGITEIVTIEGCSYCGSAGDKAPLGSGFLGVEVVDRLQIKGLDITLLNAQSATDLTGWLNANGYRFPEGAVNVLEHYIAKGWSFVAVKVDTPDEESQSMLPPPPPLWRGYFPRNPLKLTFRTDRCVFPMRISSVSSRPSGSGILIYVFAPYRVRAENFPTVEMKPPTLTVSTLADFRLAYQEAFQKLLDQPQGRALVVEYAKPSLGQDFGEFIRSLLVPWQTYYLTRLRTIFRPDHMTDDIVFVPNETNEIVDVIIFQPQSHARLWKWSLMLGLATFWFGIRRRQKTAKKEALLIGLLTTLALGGL